MNGSATQAYHFTLPASAVGTRVPVCILKGDLTAKSPYNSSELGARHRRGYPRRQGNARPTPAEYASAPMAEEDVSGKMFVAKKGVDTVYPMFKIETATAVQVRRHDLRDGAGEPRGERRFYLLSLFRHAHGAS